ncbi:MAG: 4Fe-4S dicluster domain-containing protein [Nitrososphaerota archaeon]
MWRKMIMREKVKLEKKLGEYLEDVWKCIRCGFCNSVCPTSTISRAFMASLTSRGRLILLQAYFSNILDKSLSDEKIQELMEYCFGCRRCMEVCPPGVRIPNLIWRVKQFNRERSYLRRTILIRYGSMLKLLSSVSSLSNLLLHSYIGKLLLEVVAEISRDVDFPTFYTSLEKWINKREKRQSHRGKLAYFIDVFTNYHEVDLGKKIVGLVENLGYVVVAPSQREAGTLLLEEGLIDEAYRIAKENTENLYSAIQDGARVLTSSPAAYLALKKDYPELLGDSKSRIVSENTIDIIELLLKEYEEDAIDFDKNPEAQIVYHHSCFTKASGLTKDIRRLLTSAGYTLKEIDRCCGIGGVWGMNKKHHSESIEIGLNLFNELKRMKLPIASQSETCRFQIRNNSSVEVRHPFSFIMDRVKIKN